jgi:hypothetical protein
MRIQLKSLIKENVALNESWKSANNFYVKTNKISEDELIELTKLDPSNDGYFETKTDPTLAPNKNLDAIAKWFNAGQITINNSHVKDVLTLFANLKNRKLIKPQHSDINRFRNFDKFASIVDEYMIEVSGTSGISNEFEDESDDIKLIFNEKGWQVWATKTYEATRSFIHLLYNQTDKDDHGYGMRNYNKGTCPYCIVARHHWDSYASGEDDYTMYWILKDKHEPKIIRGEGIEKVVATLDNYNPQDDPQFLDKYDENITDFDSLDPMLNKIFAKLVIKDKTFAPLELYDTFSKSDKEKYIINLLDDDTNVLSDQQFLDINHEFQQRYLINRLSLNEYFTDVNYDHADPNIKKEYIKNIINNWQSLTDHVFSTLSDDDKMAYVENASTTFNIHVTDMVFKCMTDEQKHDRIVTDPSGITLNQYKTLSDDLKFKFLLKAHTAEFVSNPKEIYENTSDDVLEKFAKILTNTYIEMEMCITNSSMFNEILFYKMSDETKIRFIKHIASCGDHAISDKIAKDLSKELSELYVKERLKIYGYIPLMVYIALNNDDAKYIAVKERLDNDGYISSGMFKYSSDALKSEYIKLMYTANKGMTPNIMELLSDDLQNKYIDGLVQNHGNILDDIVFSMLNAANQQKYIKYVISTGKYVSDDVFSLFPDKDKKDYVKVLNMMHIPIRGVMEPYSDTPNVNYESNKISLNKLLTENVLLTEAPYLKKLSEINPNDYYDRWGEIEAENFPRIYAQSSDETISDWKEPGFLGIGMFDDRNNDVHGYIYGYSFSEDELDDIESVIDDGDIEIYDDTLKDILTSDNISDIFNSKTTFYVDTFVVSKAYRDEYGKAMEYYKTIRMMIEMFFDMIGSAGYTYIVFSAMNDTMKFIINPTNGNIKVPTKRKGELAVKINSDTEPIIAIKLK